MNAIIKASWETIQEPYQQENVLITAPTGHYFEYHIFDADELAILKIYVNKNYYSTPGFFWVFFQECMQRVNVYSAENQ